MNVRLSRELDSNARSFSSCGRVRSSGDPPLGSLVQDAISELKLHREHAQRWRLRRVRFRLGRF